MKFMAKKDYLPLTDREEDVFAFILGYIVDHKYAPTRQEIADKFKFTPPGAQKFIQALEDKGRIITIKSDGKRMNRNIVIVERQTLREK